MADKRAKLTGKGGEKKELYVGFPREVVESKKFQAIYQYPHALLLLFQLWAQFKGYNNGALALTFKNAKKMGWNSPVTLQKAKKILLNSGLLMETRKGWKNKLSLYAVTWKKIDECSWISDMDAKPTVAPPGNWRD
jgi:hypothetical protein